MEFLVEIITTIAALSLIFTAVQIYLQVNKIWKRKHEVEVAESQSIAGMLIMTFNCIISILYFIVVTDDMISMIENSMYLVQAVVFGIISTGLFVRTNDKLSFIQLIRKAFKLERKEASYLIKKFLRPANAEVIINILHQLAMIDNELDPKEEELIKAFAQEWKIEYSVEKLNQDRMDTPENNYIRLRGSVDKYLESEPPKEQAAQLRDMMQALIQVDDKITFEEELISSELIGLISNYLTNEQNALVYEVLIVPQNNQHHDFVKQMMPAASMYNVSGGIAYSMGQFYSQKYAEMICNQFREVNLFTIVHFPSNRNEDVESGKKEEKA